MKILPFRLSQSLVKEYHFYLFFEKKDLLLDYSAPLNKQGFFTEFECKSSLLKDLEVLFTL